MIAFIIAVMTNTLIGVIFKYFSKYKVQAYPAIIINYLICSIIGWGLYHKDLLSPDFWLAEWVPFGLSLGVIFTIGFYLASQCVVHHGMGLTAMMQKVSMIITVLYAIIFFQESAGFMKWTGIILAMAAIILINWNFEKPNSEKRSKLWILALPVLVFLVNGTIDTTIFHVKSTDILDVDGGHFSTAIFTMAACLGIIIGSVLLIMRKISFTRKELVGGVVLGVPNFISVYSVLLAIETGWGGTVLFPLLNVSIIICSTATGYWIFAEKSNRNKILGLILAILAIVLIAI
jgi:drug/metabolite transporter (DMT)-like permease